MSVNGDITGKVQRIVREFQQAKYPAAVDEVGLRLGDPVSILPLLHFILLKFSRHVAQFILKAGYELQGKTDQKFVESCFRLFRDCFNVRTVLSPAQFLEQGYAERKLLLIVDVVATCKKLHNDELRKERLAALKRPHAQAETVNRLHEPVRKTPEVKVVRGSQEIKHVVKPRHLPNASDGAQSLYQTKSQVVTPSSSLGDGQAGASATRGIGHSKTCTVTAAAASHVFSPPHNTLGLSMGAELTLKQMQTPIHAWFVNPAFETPEELSDKQQAWWQAAASAASNTALGSFKFHPSQQQSQQQRTPDLSSASGAAAARSNVKVPWEWPLDNWGLGAAGNTNASTGAWNSDKAAQGQHISDHASEPASEVYEELSEVEVLQLASLKLQDDSEPDGPEMYAAQWQEATTAARAPETTQHQPQRPASAGYGHNLHVPQSSHAAAMANTAMGSHAPASGVGTGSHTAGPQPVPDMDAKLRALEEQLMQRVADLEAHLAAARAERTEHQRLLEAAQARTTVLEGKVRFLECELEMCSRRGEAHPPLQLSSSPTCSRTTGRHGSPHSRSHTPGHQPGHVSQLRTSHQEAMEIDGSRELTGGHCKVPHASVSSSRDLHHGQQGTSQQQQQQQQQQHHPSARAAGLTSSQGAALRGSNAYHHQAVFASMHQTISPPLTSAPTPVFTFQPAELMREFAATQEAFAHAGIHSASAAAPSNNVGHRSSTAGHSNAADGPAHASWMLRDSQSNAGSARASADASAVARGSVDNRHGLQSYQQHHTTRSSTSIAPPPQGMALGSSTLQMPAYQPAAAGYRSSNGGGFIAHSSNPASTTPPGAATATVTTPPSLASANTNAVVSQVGMRMDEASAFMRGLWQR